MKAKFVYFDVGGVLVKDDRQTAYRRFQEKHGYGSEFIDELLHQYYIEANLGQVRSLAEYLKKYDLTFDGFGHEDVRAVLQAHYELMFVDEEVVAIARSVQERAGVGIITNWEIAAIEWMERWGFTGDFNPIVISAAVGMVKPKREIYEHAVQLVGCRPSDIIFVDDKKENVDGAEAVGMVGVVFRNADQLTRDLKTLLS